MRIDLNTNTSQAAENSKAARSAASAPHSAAGDRSAQGVDEARLSPDHARVQSLVASASRLPEVRQGKVDALQQAVQRGSYNVSPKQVAESVFSEMLAHSG